MKLLVYWCGFMGLNIKPTYILLENVVPHSTIDDEYANATERDPKILLTTSRNPSAPLTQFVKVVKFQILICIYSMG